MYTNIYILETMRSPSRALRFTQDRTGITQRLSWDLRIKIKKEWSGPTSDGFEHVLTALIMICIFVVAFGRFHTSKKKQKHPQKEQLGRSPGLPGPPRTPWRPPGTPGDPQGTPGPPGYAPGTPGDLSWIPADPLDAANTRQDPQMPPHGLLYHVYFEN